MKGFVMATITAGLKDSPRLNPAAVQAGVRATLEAIYEPILSDLGRVERLLRDTLDSDSDFIAELVKRVQLYGGKRMRPAMLLLAAKACGVVTPDHDKLAACIEVSSAIRSRLLAQYGRPHKLMLCPTVRSFAIDSSAEARRGRHSKGWRRSCLRRSARRVGRRAFARVPRHP